MSALTRPLATPNLLDNLLLDTAIRIQLSPPMHELAVERYKQIAEWIDRAGSGLRGRVRLVYPQGSMAIGATIRTKEADDLFDIDLIAEIDWPPETTPMDMLWELYLVIRGEKRSLYYDKTILQTRCVTIQYAEMHLDITPLARNPQWPERGGWIAHARLGAPETNHKFVPANPWGFAHDFADKTFAELPVALPGQLPRAAPDLVAFARRGSVAGGALSALGRHCIGYCERCPSERLIGPGSFGVEWLLR